MNAKRHMVDQNLTSLRAWRSSHYQVKQQGQQLLLAQTESMNELRSTLEPTKAETRLRNFYSLNK